MSCMKKMSPSSLDQRMELFQLQKEVASQQRTITRLKYDNKRLQKEVAFQRRTITSLKDDNENHRAELLYQGSNHDTSDPKWPFEDDYQEYEKIEIRNVEYFILPEKEWYHVETDADMSVSIILLNTEGELFGVYNKITGEMTDVDWEDENKD